MFGHQDKKDEDENDNATATATAPEVTPDQPADDTANASTDDAAKSDAADAPTDNAATTDTAPSEEMTGVGGVADDDADAWQHPGEPIDDDSPEQISDIIAPAGGGSVNAPPSLPKPSFTTPPPTSLLPAHGEDEDEENHTPHELIDIKQKALHELSPLMGQLELEPEDKFRTLMMMIQASDDQKLVKEAYEVAHKIKDDKIRAQALLDVVNEINYFTQHPVVE